MENITIKELYQYSFLSEVNASPDGSKVLFTRSMANEEYNQYTSRLYCLDTATEEVRAITAKGSERSAIWMDKDHILFTTASANKEGKTTYFKLNMKGGEAVEAFTIPARVTGLKKLNDDLYLMLGSKKVVVESNGGSNRAVEGKDFLIFDEIPFWANGQGVRNKIRSMAMLFVPSTGEIKEISGKFTNVMGVYPSEDGSKILFWGPTFENKMSVHSELYEYHVASGYTKTLLGQDQLAINFACYFNGKVLFEGSDKKDNSSQDPNLYTIEASGEVKRLNYLDGALGNSSGSDVAYGGGRTMKVIGDKLFCLFTSWGNSYLSFLNEAGELKHVNRTMGSINCFDIAGDVAYCVALRDYELQEIYAINRKDGSEKKLTSFNEDFVKNHQIVKPDYFTFTAKEGHVLEGWVLKPANYVPGKKYPGILTMHGGPKAAFGTNYNHEMQCMAHMDMFVFYTNPRGSSGRGEAFSRLVGQLGETDYNDFMAFTDEVLRRYEDIDGEKLGICGGSYGGFMCNWMIGNTNRFKAAASQRSISNYLSKCLTTDIGYYHNLSQMASSPWDNAEKMWYHSPLKYVQNAITPTLFIQSDEDYRCWMSEPLQMFTNLRQRGIPSKICLFHGENHELSRAGKPHNRIGRLTEICNWFATYLA